ncbi:MAG: hypothetical protein AABW50_05935 [Nanoarchaeota archaeon]
MDRVVNWKPLAEYMVEKFKERKGSLWAVSFGCNEDLVRYLSDNRFTLEGIYSSNGSTRSKILRLSYNKSLNDLNGIGDNRYDVGICNGELHGVQFDLIPKALQEMRRVCSDYLFLGFDKDEFAGSDAQWESWWDEQLHKLGNFQKLKPGFFEELKGRHILRYAVNLRNGQ